MKQSAFLLLDRKVLRISYRQAASYLLLVRRRDPAKLGGGLVTRLMPEQPPLCGWCTLHTLFKNALKRLAYYGNIKEDICYFKRYIAMESHNFRRFEK